MKRLIILLAALLIPLAAVPASAAQLRVFVAEMNAVGVQNRDEMKVTLQTLLASRLNNERIVAVGSAAEADVLVSGTYIAIGKMFSVDALARTSAGRTLTRTFVQGESQDELIPAVGKLADKLSAELVKLYSGGPLAAPGVSLAPVPAAKTEIIRSEQQVRLAPAGEFIKPRDYEQGSSGGWVSKRLDGAANLMATGKTLPDGSREIFLAENRRLSCYRQARDMKLVSEAEFKATEKIVSLDTLDTVAGMDIYVTIIRGDDLASQVWQMQGDKLIRVAENLPFFFRAFSLAGGPKRLYAQPMGRDRDFFGAVSEATRQGANITLKNPIQMPRFGDIYTFNQFRDSEGKILTVVINPDNYLVVYDQGLKELWRSNDKFGGSELYFQKEDLENARTTGDKNRWIFMNQRIQVTAGGEVLVGRNDGFFVIGNARSYKKGAVYCLLWNGSSLEEKWRTKETQNYMPDYWLDESRNELLILQTVQRPGIATTGASSLSVKKVE
ncbi:MAG: VCBS repeat-containing protein [Deltaproteobacteria bacterium]|nr:VCBS repeat-containing protein [Deltaproteobacteria bacterium]